MTEPSDWRLYTVQDFFQGDWLEEPLPSKPVRLPHIADNWQCQTVEDFFQGHNWAGPLNPQASHISRSVANALTTPVGEYLSAIPWGGRPLIAVLPSIPTPSGSAHADHDLNLSDLSNLF